MYMINDNAPINRERVRDRIKRTVTNHSDHNERDQHADTVILSRTDLRRPHLPISNYGAEIPLCWQCGEETNHCHLLHLGVSDVVDMRSSLSLLRNAHRSRIYHHNNNYPTTHLSSQHHHRQSSHICCSCNNNNNNNTSTTTLLTAITTNTTYDVTDGRTGSSQSQE